MRRKSIWERKEYVILILPNKHIYSYRNELVYFGRTLMGNIKSWRKSKEKYVAFSSGYSNEDKDMSLLNTDWSIRT